MPHALSGIKILDLSRVLAGPYCTMILGDLGAEVIKIESPNGGDDTRRWGPPFQNEVSAYYLCANRNKKSITIDLKSKEGIERVKQLIIEADVIINNFKSGTMEKFGLDYEAIASINKRIVYCSITGFGETGSYKDMPGYDFIIQAMSGFMSITGTEASGPQKVGVAIVDVLTGLYATIGIQAALLERETSGRGQKLDLSLYDSAVSALINIGSNYLMNGKIPGRLGNEHANIVPYQTFITSDGEMVIAVGNDHQFKTLCTMIGHPTLAENPKFMTNPARVEHRNELVPILQRAFLQKETSYWKRLCDEHTIPCGPIQDLDQVFHDVQLNEREMFIQSEHPTAGTIRMIGSPLKLSRTPVTYRHHPPIVGEHNDEVFKN
ncbi:CaiB/BaiF CoA transferase family protein [Pseudogracilibacillus auburnensis]|uniref:Crotonobetainyl-CoA:carnitine CoA-transferase CaiB-like acyl-CoA transferase n=1 Tax=Pseudogracilibacillus auburnensis TaxID=1494959 RepID=A0A2V3VL09_9BACI|nr:CoA transferase [Pseudogracilibacillus auburnensis]PXW82477.1 crotonobetainyl-CoA:carnitine CoA-transferase CaiB-like acyl-CoA transferase [Pseudogracilibacillus auburnensis]